MIFPVAILLLAGSISAGFLLAGTPAEAQTAQAQSVQAPATRQSAVPASTQSALAPASGPAGASRTPDDKTSPATAPSAAGAAAQDAAAPETSMAGTGSALIPHDLSPVGMFMHADIVVKAVMIGLAIASLVTWTILLAKAVELMSARGMASRGLSRIAAAPSLREAAAGFGTSKAPAARLVAAALNETDRSRGLSHEGIKERTVALLGRIESRAGRAMGRGTGILATIGSTAPFVGLFGTVWGIMNSFIGISKTNTTNLAVVAPGIAEALLATATGLVAAIPAVIIYNLFARSITGYRQMLVDASTEVLRLQSRDLDRGELDRLPHGGVARQQAAE